LQGQGGGFDFPPCVASPESETPAQSGIPQLNPHVKTAILKPKKRW